jgi:hypothetical protein
MMGRTTGVFGLERLLLCVVGALLLPSGCDSGIKKENRAVWGRVSVLQAKVDGMDLGGVVTIGEPIWAMSGTVKAGQTFNAQVTLSGPAAVGGQTFVVVYAVDEDTSFEAEKNVLNNVVYSIVVAQGQQQFTLPFQAKPILPATRHVQYWVHAQGAGGAAHGTITVTP